MDENVEDICRVCRSEGSTDRPLFHPCICTGSIKYIHQDCLVQWLKYSEKEYCELCSHRFSFIPIYSPDMPRRLPIRDIVAGLLKRLGVAIRFWIHYAFVAAVWLGAVPLTSYRIYKFLFTGSLTSLMSFPTYLISSENLASDGFYGCCVVTCNLCAFIVLLWLKEQMTRGDGPEWLEPQLEVAALPQLPRQDIGVGLNNNINNNNMGEDANIFDNETDMVPENNPIAAPAEVQPIQENQANQDDGNWNHPEWDRGPEEITWEKIFGLDGSLAFLEHIFWVISLNTLFIFIFAFFPYHIGSFTIGKISFIDLSKASSFGGIVTTLCGYIVIGIVLVTLHFCASILNMRRTQRLLGLCYVVVKVPLLVVFELGIYPLLCGWWVDICSLSLLGATLADREASFKSAPTTSMFIHWVIGLVYVFYFASLTHLLREVLRPEVLWFLHNLDDPDFNPVQEMIHLSIMGHIRKFSIIMFTFAITILLMIWIPVCIVQKFLPGFLPYYVDTSNSYSSEGSTDFFLFQLLLPTLMNCSHPRKLLKDLIKGWCSLVSYILGMRSYLLGDPETTMEEYDQPKWFSLKLLLLLLFTCITLQVIGLLILTIPVTIGRLLLSLWTGDTKVPEVNAAICGFYVLVDLARWGRLLINWIPRGWSAIAYKIEEGILVTCKTLCASLLLLGLIPLLVGLLFDVVVIVPFRVSIDQTPVFNLWQDWAFGVLQIMIICGFAMIGEGWLREVLIEIYQGGLFNINLKYIVSTIALPVVLILGSILTFPYVIIFGLMPLFGVCFETRNLLIRRSYPSLLIGIGLIYLIHWQINKFCHLCEHIKNDKYLVGKRLVNYDPKKNSKSIN